MSKFPLACTSTWLSSSINMVGIKHGSKELKPSFEESMWCESLDSIAHILGYETIITRALPLGTCTTILYKKVAKVPKISQMQVCFWENNKACLCCGLVIPRHNASVFCDFQNVPAFVILKNTIVFLTKHNVSMLCWAKNMLVFLAEHNMSRFFSLKKNIPLIL